MSASAQKKTLQHQNYFENWNQKIFDCSEG